METSRHANKRLVWAPSFELLAYMRAWETEARQQLASESKPKKHLDHHPAPAHYAPRLGSLVEAIRETMAFMRTGIPPADSAEFGFEFEAIVGFIDMRGFTQLARDLPPIRVRNVATPFISKVLKVVDR